MKPRSSPKRATPLAPPRIVSSAHLAVGRGAEVSEFEYGMIICGHAFHRWIVRCMAAAGMKDLTPIDVLALHHVNHRARNKKLADICFVLNVEDAAAGKPAPEDVVKAAGGAPVFVLSGNAEMEIAQLAPEDQAAFLQDLGLTEPARARFIRACYALLDLISMFTAGDDEVKAWTIHRGDPARKAAGKIHSDIERGFIRAEVIRHEDYVQYGTEAKCREHGKLRLEGKDYVVQDGDVVNFRFNV